MCPGTEEWALNNDFEMKLNPTENTYPTLIKFWIKVKEMSLFLSPYFNCNMMKSFF